MCVLIAGSGAWRRAMIACAGGAVIALNTGCSFASNLKTRNFDWLIKKCACLSLGSGLARLANRSRRSSCARSSRNSVWSFCSDRSLRSVLSRWSWRSGLIGENSGATDCSLTSRQSRCSRRTWRSRIAGFSTRSTVRVESLVSGFAGWSFGSGWSLKRLNYQFQSIKNNYSWSHLSDRTVEAEFLLPGCVCVSRRVFARFAVQSFKKFLNKKLFSKNIRLPGFPSSASFPSLPKIAFFSHYSFP